MPISIIVALFTRAWIEMDKNYTIDIGTKVALFTRAWIEITLPKGRGQYVAVALFTRAWIEIVAKIGEDFGTKRRPLHEGVD